MTLRKKTQREASSGRCCICHQLVIQTCHYIIPVSERGDDTYDNSAPVCESCHALIVSDGSNRTQVHSTRDTWYELIRNTKRKEVIQKDLEISDETFKFYYIMRIIKEDILKRMIIFKTDNLSII